MAAPVPSIVPAQTPKSAVAAHADSRLLSLADLPAPWQPHSRPSLGLCCARKLLPYPALANCAVPPRRCTSALPTCALEQATLERLSRHCRCWCTTFTPRWQQLRQQQGPQGQVHTSSQAAGRQACSASSSQNKQHPQQESRRGGQAAGVGGVRMKRRQLRMLGWLAPAPS